MDSLPAYIYSVRYMGALKRYLLTFWSPVTGKCVHFDCLYFVPTEEQMNDMNLALTTSEVLLEDGPTPLYPLYRVFPY